VNILEILDTKGLNAAIEAAEDHPKEMIVFITRCAQEVQRLMQVQRSITKFNVAERYAQGEATDKKLFAEWKDVDASSCAAAKDAWNTAKNAVLTLERQKEIFRETFKDVRAQTTGSPSAS
jgi:hypothetical protein